MTKALHLAVQKDGLASLVFDSAPKKVNVFTRQVLAELEELLTDLTERDDIAVLVLHSGKAGNFIAGFDVEEIAAVTDPQEAADGARLGQRLFDRWNRLPFPTVTAIQGTCLGGGTELALASDYIVISDRADIRIGLPEVRLGIVPAWGGCSRLPQRIGIAAALDIILAGKAINSQKAYKICLVDALMPDAGFLHHVWSFAESIANDTRPGRQTINIGSRLLEGNQLGRGIVFSQARKRVLEKTRGHYPAPLRAIEVIEIGVARGLEAGLAAEARATGELAVSAISKNLVHVFQLMEGLRNENLPANPREVRVAAVLGAGIMGGGIAQLIAGFAEIPVRLKDLSAEPLAKGLAHAEELFAKRVKRRRMSKPEAKTKMNLLRPSLDYSGFERADLVIEAVVENLEIKQRVFAEVASFVPENTVLASNTSSLSIDLIAENTPVPSRVVGMHFFNPVHRMPLVEVVRGSGTTDQAVATVVAFARQLGKTPIVVADGPGFLVNRLLGFYMTEALWLLEDGYSVEDIDATMIDWGMPMGPFALIDEVGTDVAVKVAHILAAAFGDRLPLPSWSDRLSDSDRLGAKTGKGIYRYAQGERRQSDPKIYSLLGLSKPTRAGDPGMVVDRLVLPMVNEAARCLEDEIVGSAGHLDMAMIMGTGFPPFRGGLCRWFDQQGPRELLGLLDRFGVEIDERYRPSASLTRISERGGFYAVYGSD